MGDFLTQYRPSTLAKPLKIQAQVNSSCVLDNNLDVSCWGSGGSLGGFSGISGYNPETNGFLAQVGSNRKVLNFIKGFRHGCVLLDNYEVKCFGGDFAILGYEGPDSIGGNAATIGDNLGFVNLGDISYPVELSITEFSTCARFANGLMKCWGRGDDGILASGSTSNVGGTPGSMGNNLPFVNLGGPIKQLFSMNHAYSSRCALRTNDELICWGLGQAGQLGNGVGGFGNRIGDHPSELGANLPVINLNGSVPMQMESSSDHACALTTDSEIKCWGNNFWGQLGLGDVVNRGSAPGQMGAALPTVDIIW